MLSTPTLPETCVACSGRLNPATIFGRHTGVGIEAATCETCNGLHFAGERGLALELVRFDRMAADAAPEHLRYFDFTVEYLAELYRVHGWFDTRTGSVVQFG